MLFMIIRISVIIILQPPLADDGDAPAFCAKAFCANGLVGCGEGGGLPKM